MDKYLDLLYCRSSPTSPPKKKEKKEKKKEDPLKLLVSYLHIHNSSRSNKRCNITLDCDFLSSPDCWCGQGWSAPAPVHLLHQPTGQTSQEWSLPYTRGPGIEDFRQDKFRYLMFTITVKSGYKGSTLGPWKLPCYIRFRVLSGVKNRNIK